MKFSKGLYLPIKHASYYAQLEQPIVVPFMPRHRLTTERVLTEIERVIQSHKEFNEVNVIHVEMPQGGVGTKRSEVDLEKPS